MYIPLFEAPTFELMSPDISANKREDETSLPIYQALVNTTPIAHGEEPDHTYATLSPALSPDNKARLGQHAWYLNCK